VSAAAGHVGMRSALVFLPCGIFHREWFSLVFSWREEATVAARGGFDDSKLSAAHGIGLPEVFPLKICNLIFSELDLGFCISP